MQPLDIVLSLLPYVASIAMYVISVRELFALGASEVPAGAPLKLAASVGIGGGLTPLALAAQAHSKVPLLLTASAAAVVYVFICLIVTRETGVYRKLYRPVAVLGRIPFEVLHGRQVLVMAGVAVICYGALVTVVLSR